MSLETYQWDLHYDSTILSVAVTDFIVYHFKSHSRRNGKFINKTTQFAICVKQIIFLSDMRVYRYHLCNDTQIWLDCGLRFVSKTDCGLLGNSFTKYNWTFSVTKSNLEKLTRKQYSREINSSLNIFFYLSFAPISDTTFL